MQELALAPSTSPSPSDSPTPAETPPRRRLRATVPLVGLFVLAVLYTLHFASPVVMPVVLAVVLSLALSPFVRLLERIHVPRGLGAALVVVGFIAAIVGGAYLVADPAAEW